MRIEAMRCCLLPVLATALPLLGGCPEPTTSSDATIVARIGINATSGAPPFEVSVSGEASTSENGAIVSYFWDFAGEAQVQGVTARHTFTSVGRLPVTLTVVDETGAEASERVDVRLTEGDITAVIDASPLSGTAPLVVRFDGTSSTAPGDTIRDYFWDFGDGESARDSAPTHAYRRAGTFTATLRVVSGGGAEATATATIQVGSSTAARSLQFNGQQFATLPVNADDLEGFTFEAWCRPDGGGTLVTFGVPGWSLDVLPDAGRFELDAGGTRNVVEGGENGWMHVAFTSDPNDGLHFYVDGDPIATLPAAASPVITTLSLGGGFEGNVARVRFWGRALSDMEVAAAVSGSVSGFDDGLLGEWPLDDGSGQDLTNTVSGASAGVLGTSGAPESSDPAWSTDGP